MPKVDLEWTRKLGAIVAHPEYVSGTELLMAQNFIHYRGKPKGDDEKIIEQAYARVMAKEKSDGLA